MKISIINGSQKPNGSNTSIILSVLNNLLGKDNDIDNYTLGVNQFSEEIYNKIVLSDVIVFAFPLYTDSIPSNMLKMLIELEGFFGREKAKETVVYAIINNGFYEGKQTHIAFEIIQNWCERSGVLCGGGIGQGAGEMIGATRETPLNKGPFNNLWRALKLLTEKIETKEPVGVKYLSPYFPRFLWKIMAHNAFWHPLAYKNKLTKKDIVNKIEY
ncbi:MAG: NAD(P)H-dependent oxidoreductase [Treponema sp.]|jgi:multimeric flavodoxin WrbA|nr:NAD(P)H-dependent oxidoreductase [Treponema sp.]